MVAKLCHCVSGFNLISSSLTVGLLSRWTTGASCSDIVISCPIVNMINMRLVLSSSSVVCIYLCKLCLCLIDKLFNCYCLNHHQPNA